LAYVNAQIGKGSGTGFINQNVAPPDWGDWGACGPDAADGASCSITCDNNGPGYVWNIAGPPYVCSDGKWTGGPQSCQFADYQYGKKNCTFPLWSQFQFTQTQCTSNCGGTQTNTRSVYSLGEPGGVPCPALSWTSYCGSLYCTAEMVTGGYYYWGPFCSANAPRTINYRILTDQNIDLYVFDQPDYTRYTWDSDLATPLNTYYYPEYAHLATNYEVDSFTVPAGNCYMLVLDNTNVGPTQVNTQPFNVHFSFSGINTADGFTDYQNQYGVFQPSSVSRSASVSFFAVFLAMIVVVVLQFA